jgi:hypothetical protein
VQRIVAIDSNALTYFVEAIEPGYDPTADAPDLAFERVAMIRSYLYGGVCFWIMPTAQEEYLRIRDPVRHKQHQSTAWVLFLDHPVSAEPALIENRAQELAQFHANLSDCMVVAEAEAAGVPALLTRDSALILHLGQQTALTIQYPSTYWRTLGIGPGSPLQLAPHSSNPLLTATWWRI